MGLADQQAREWNHQYVGTEHMLMALVTEGTGVGANVLRDLGANAGSVRSALGKLVKPGTEKVAPGKLPRTPRAKEAMARAAEEARILGHNYLGTEHVLLGLLHNREGVAAKALMALDLDPGQVSQEVLDILGVGDAYGLLAAARAGKGPEGPRRLKQFILTPSMGKRLIGRAMAAHPAIRDVLESGTLVIVAGTTNGYVAEEILAATGQQEGFTREGFRRGVTVPPGKKAPQAEFKGDVVLVKGAWQKGKEIFDVADDLKVGDVVLKGANALSSDLTRAAVLIGHPQAGTIGAALPAVFGRRVRLIIPVGLEKRICDDLDQIAAEVNAPEAEGPRLLPMPGEPFTELDAIELLSDAEAFLVAAGGICGAEGTVWVAVRGSDQQVAAAEEIIASVADEPPCEV